MLPAGGGDSWGVQAAGLDLLGRVGVAEQWMLDGGAGRPARNHEGMPIVAPSGPRHRSSVKTSTYRGVATTDNGTWRARIRFGKYTVHLGRCVAAGWWARGFIVRVCIEGVECAADRCCGAGVMRAVLQRL
jgi:hypothetical protein